MTDVPEILERKETFHTEAGLYTGVAFSPSEQYLYANDNTHLWQWDLLSDNIGASQTLIDTFDGFVQPGWFGTYFGPMKPAPDGRIYIVPPSGSSEFMHVIDRPDLQASECRFLQHYIDLKVPNGRSAPNIPNFRLGSLDNSSCDTLGIDNFPVSRWRYEEDQQGFRHSIRFTDLSFFDPIHWHWDFDDGSNSEEQSPVHTFEEGLFYVCLTVSNDYGTDSTCQWVEILPTGISEDADASFSDLTVNPNPFRDELNVQSKSGIFREAHIQMWDIHGRNVFDQSSIPIPVKLFLPPLLPGMYFLTIKENDGTSSSFKLMKI